MSQAFEIKFRRGTTTEHSTFVGGDGEVTIDTNKQVPVVHDGETPGGNPIASEDYVSRVSSTLATQIANLAGASAAFGSETMQIIPIDPDAKAQMQWGVVTTSSDDSILDVDDDIIIFKKAARYEFTSNLVIKRAGSANNITLHFDIVDADDNVIQSVSETMQFRVDSDNQVSLNTLIDITEEMLEEGDVTLKVMMGVTTSAGTVSLRRMHTILALSRVGQPLLKITDELGDDPTAVINQKTVTEELKARYVKSSNIEINVGDTPEDDFADLQSAILAATEIVTFATNLDSNLTGKNKVIINFNRDTSIYESIKVYGMDLTNIEFRGNVTAANNSELVFVNCSNITFNMTRYSQNIRFFGCNVVTINMRQDLDTTTLFTCNILMFQSCSSVIIGRISPMNLVCLLSLVNINYLLQQKDSIVNGSIVQIKVLEFDTKAISTTTIKADSNYTNSLSSFFPTVFKSRAKIIVDNLVVKNGYNNNLTNVLLYNIDFTLASVTGLEYAGITNTLYVNQAQESTIIFGTKAQANKIGLRSVDDSYVKSNVLVEYKGKLNTDSILKVTNSEIEVNKLHFNSSLFNNLNGLIMLDTSKLTVLGYDTIQDYEYKKHLADCGTIEFPSSPSRHFINVINGSELFLFSNLVIPNAPTSPNKVINMSSGSKVTCHPSTLCNITTAGISASGIKCHITPEAKPVP